ncbi:NAD(P)H-binding protein [Micromonospora echinofusca]|uniref:NAD(P)H-binding protein n=1 Tax=Micromonospora echinofusca TaxID=47858 RepID=A0ABS3VJ83_MICEH|nr:NAD(P)H-binding protein [Micromonospora echinofusca]
MFGAGGRAGRQVVAEAVSRGHRVTAVVRDAVRHRDLAAPAVTVAEGDITSVGDVARLSAGHRAVVHAAARTDVPADSFFPVAGRALVEGLPVAGVNRLVVIGIGTVLETAPGVAVHDAPGFPAEGRAFSRGHAAQLDVLRGAVGVDWVVLAPPPVLLDDAAPRTGRYRTGGHQLLSGGPDPAAFSYADLAVAVVDEIDSPRHHRTLVAVGW